MIRFFPALVAIAFSAASVRADWLLNTYPVTTSDSSTTNARYGIQSAQNAASAVTTQVFGGTPGYASLVATKIASNGTEGFSALYSLLHPLTTDKAAYDLTGLTGVSFEYQNTTNITDNLTVSFDSEAYTPEAVSQGLVYRNTVAGYASLIATTDASWKRGYLDIMDFSPPNYWAPPVDYPSIEAVLKRVKSIRFSPKTLYQTSGTWNGAACSRCVTPNMASLTLNIRNVTLLGVNHLPWPNKDGFGCVDASLSTPFSNFASKSSLNSAGGSFYSFSDFDTSGTSTDLTKGRTTLEDSIIAGANESSSYYELRAKLNKKVGSTYHARSGWAGIGTNFGTGKYAVGTDLTGISFAIGNLGINTQRVQTIDFKIKMSGVSDTAAHMISLPVKDIIDAGATGKIACIRPIDLEQASSVSAAHRVAFNPAKIEHLSWEAKMVDIGPTIDTATANFYVSDIKWHGMNGIKLGGAIGTVGINGRNPTKTFATYSNSVLSLSGFSSESTLYITTLDGKVVASFASAPRIALSLPHGTYLLTAKNGSFSQKFAVVGR